jgi:hypothetical protein
MSSTDPKRLISLENVPELSDALQAARERLPDSNKLEALRARVEAAAGAPAPPLMKSWPSALKLVLPLLGVAGLLIGTQRIVRRAEAPSPRVSPTAHASSTPAPSSAPAPNSTRPLPAPMSSAPALPRPSVTSARPPVVTARPVDSAAQVSSELDLVKQAGLALKSDPARALQLTMHHARLYPGGELAEEREVIAIEALARLGRPNAARSRAERFMVVFPRSAHLSRVQHAAGLDAQTDAGDQNNGTPRAL